MQLLVFNSRELDVACQYSEIIQIVWFLFKYIQYDNG